MSKNKKEVNTGKIFWLVIIASIAAILVLIGSALNFKNPFVWIFRIVIAGVMLAIGYILGMKSKKANVAKTLNMNSTIMIFIAIIVLLAALLLGLIITTIKISNPVTWIVYILVVAAFLAVGFLLGKKVSADDSADKE